jgi:hypothetical protein
MDKLENSACFMDQAGVLCIAGAPGAIPATRGSAHRKKQENTSRDAFIECKAFAFARVTPSLVAQHAHRIDARRAPGRKVGGAEHDDGEQRGGRDERQRVAGLDA